MSRFKTWLALAFASMLYAAFGGSLEDFAACIYFSALALGMHWFFNRTPKSED